MNDDNAWNRMVDAIEAKFGLTSHGRGTRPIADAPDLEESYAYIVFECEGHSLKLERTTGPAIIERKTIGAKRSGATLTYQNVYDTSETARRTHLFRDNLGEWIEVDARELEL